MDEGRFDGGFDILETDDAQKLFEFAYMGNLDGVGDNPGPGRPGIENDS
jgi:hypothetical protein